MRRHAMTAPSLSRRGLLTGALGLAATQLPLALPARPSLAAGNAGQVLLLVELNGGNDSLNAFVPYADPAYHAARPKLAIPRDQVLQLDENLGLHPALAPLLPAWRERDLALAQGVGYPAPNRSHFRSIEIWNSASDSDELLTDGWVATTLRDGPTGGATDAVVLGGTTGPLAGTAIQTVALRRPERFLSQARMLESGGRTADNPALGHILDVRDGIQESAREMKALLKRAPRLDKAFPATSLGRQFSVAARLILTGIPLRAIKVVQSGYDTHAGQAYRHHRLLENLGQSLAALRDALSESDAWSRTLVMSYAEFGRRVGENGSVGTDHGTAATHFLMGGRVRGGLYGRQPSLTDLAGGDLRHNVDFRQLYATVARDWWNLPTGGSPLAGHRPLALLA